MNESVSDRKRSTLQLIFVPALISLAVTLIRLTGELRHWSPAWFSSGQGLSGPVSWVVGITWLAIPFGAYFGIRLAASTGKAPRLLRSLPWAVVGVVVIYVSQFLSQFIRFMHLKFPESLIPFWLLVACAAAIQYLAWPALFKTLLAYALSARLPVVLIYFLAMSGNWGTHYDYVGMPPEFSMPLLPRFLWLAFFPQLTLWLGFTIVAGSVAGVIAGAMVRKPATATAGTTM
jgi:hypothetical protein